MYRNAIFLFSAFLLMFLMSETLFADDIPVIRDQARRCVQTTEKLNSIVRKHAEAGSEIALSSEQLQKHAKEFSSSALNADHPKKASQEEFWKLIRHRRNFDAVLSVSKLRKNSDIKSALNALDDTIAKLKPHFS